MSKEREFQKSVKRSLQRQQVGDDARRALRQARMQALDSTALSPSRRWLPAMAFSCVALAAGAYLLLQQVEDAQLPQDAIEDFALISGEDDLELLQELEFYVWFDQDKEV